jgi:hypothetical protein
MAQASELGNLLVIGTLHVCQPQQLPFADLQLLKRLSQFKLTIQLGRAGARFGKIIGHRGVAMATPAVTQKIGSNAKQVVPMLSVTYVRKLAQEKAAIYFLQQIFGYGALSRDSQQICEKLRRRLLV